MAEKSHRPKYQTASIILRTEDAHALACARLMAAPIDPLRPLEMLIREYKKPSSYEQQERMFAGIICDFAEQGWMDGKQYSKDWWHFFLKFTYLPDVYNDIECLDGYEKWQEIRGVRHMVGSTKKLTTVGHMNYITQCEAFGASLGILFSANPREWRE